MSVLSAEQLSKIIYKEKTRRIQVKSDCHGLKLKKKNSILSKPQENIQKVKADNKI